MNLLEEDSWAEEVSVANNYPIISGYPDSTKMNEFNQINAQLVIIKKVGISKIKPQFLQIFADHPYALNFLLFAYLSQHDNDDPIVIKKLLTYKHVLNPGTIFSNEASCLHRGKNALHFFGTYYHKELHYLPSENKREGLQLLLKETRPNINMKDPDSQTTLLMQYCMVNNPHMVKILLEYPGTNCEIISEDKNAFRRAQDYGALNYSALTRETIENRALILKLFEDHFQTDHHKKVCCKSVENA